MIHKVGRHMPHWERVIHSSTKESVHRALAPKGGSRLMERCDACGELYDPRHSYEVLHHLHGRRFDANPSH